MSGRLARERGRKFEIETAKALSALWGVDLKRKLGQARDSGNDIDAPPFRIECKRTRRLGYLSSWMQQAIAAADQPFDVPVVVCREDEGEPLVILRLEDFAELAKPVVALSRELHP